MMNRNYSFECDRYKWGTHSFIIHIFNIFRQYVPITGKLGEIYLKGVVPSSYRIELK